MAPTGEVVDCAVVFGAIVEMKPGGGLEIPSNGVVISCPRRTLPGTALPELLRRFGAHVDFQLLHEKSGMAEIATALGAGPILLKDGEILPKSFFQRTDSPEQFIPARKVDGAFAQIGIVPTRFPHDVDKTRAPRTILGLTQDNRLVLAVIDGRHVAHSLGATLEEAAGLARALGCTDALNLDGGGSSVMFVNGPREARHPMQPGVPQGIVNIPSDSGSQDRLMPVPLLVVD
jgi:hypothetical protein